MAASPFLPLPAGLEIERTCLSAATLTMQVCSTARKAPCPLCQHQATRIHSRYQRAVADLPCGGRQVLLILTVHKFFGDEPTCPRRIFTERLPTLVRPWGQMTLRLSAALQAIGLASCGEVGARLGARLGMPVSPTTVLRQVMAVPPPPVGQIQGLGIDEWGATRSCMCSCKDSRKEALTWGSAPSAEPSLNQVRLGQCSRTRQGGLKPVRGRDGC